MWAESILILITRGESDLSYCSGKDKQAQMQYGEGPWLLPREPPGEPGGAVLTASGEPSWGHSKGGSVLKGSPCTQWLFSLCLNINVLFGYKTANGFAFLLCFCRVQDFIRIWPYSKCAKKNDGSPWIPWFGWNWLQWWHLCKYCYLQAMLSGDSAFIYIGLLSLL